MVTMVPKKEGTLDPKQRRPLAVTCMLYRVWGGIRHAALRDWVAGWAPPELHGGVAGRHLSDATRKISTRIEHALVSGKG